MNYITTFLTQVSVLSSDILNASESRYFWISWLSSNIEVGKGNIVGHDQIMSWQDPSYSCQVSKTAVSTGWGSTGEWDLTVYEGSSFYVAHAKDWKI